HSQHPHFVLLESPVTKRRHFVSACLPAFSPSATFDEPLLLAETGKPMALSIDDLLRRAVETKASDLHLKVGNHPYLRVEGVLTPLSDVPRVTPEEMLSMAFSMMTNRLNKKFKESAELDMAYGVSGLGPFRVNVFQQRGNVAKVLRVIPPKIRTYEEKIC